MSFNGTYRGCCCGGGETEPCACSLYENCLDYIRENCNFGCNEILKALRDNLCNDPKDPESYFCPIETNGILEEGIKCEVRCEGSNKTTWSDPCNNELFSGQPEFGFSGLICGQTCDELYPGEGKIIGWDGLCWSGDCKDESQNGSSILQGSQSIKYITDPNEPCPKAIHVYTAYLPSENGCCEGGSSSFAIFDGFEGLTDTFIVEYLLPQGDKCINCFTCAEYIAKSIRGEILDETCPQFTCADITDIEQDQNLPKCYGYCDAPIETGNSKCPTPCEVCNDPPFQSYYEVNQIVECGCPCGQDKVYNCKCVECTSTGGTLANCCEVEVEGFNFIAAIQSNVLRSECPEYPAIDICCDSPRYELPEECACWGALYGRENSDSEEWTLITNSEPFRGCITACETISNCYCTNFQIPPNEPIYIASVSPGEPQLIKCDHGSFCCPCTKLDGNGEPDFSEPPVPLLKTCTDSKGNPQCPSGYEFGSLTIPSGFECCQN